MIINNTVDLRDRIIFVGSINVCVISWAIKIRTDLLHHSKPFLKEGNFSSFANGISFSLVLI